MARDQEAGHRWAPIQDVPEDHARLRQADVHTLMSIWREQKADLETRDTVKRFNAQLLRRWAIETGLIERLYTLDRGVTELLVERGLHASLIPHDPANGDPALVMDMILDQHAAVEGLFDFVASRRELGTAYIKQLHAMLTASQDHTTAVNSLGQRVRIALRRGDYKRRPNNPRTLDGAEHEYCPPEQVASEMDRLVAMHLSHEEKGVGPEVQAAWLHHRFTQIHPFEDGNGRVARALATLVLLRAGWLPLVVTNDRRAAYLDASRAADRGRLGPLVRLFAKIEQEAFLGALNVADAVIRHQRSIDHVIAAWRDDFEKRDAVLRDDWEAAKITAQRLQAVTADRLSNLRDKLEQQIGALAREASFEVIVDRNNADERTHWFRYQLIETAKQLNYFANLKPCHLWTRLVVKTETKAEILISFHAVGREYRGVLLGSACFFEKDPGGDYVLPARGIRSLTEEPFQFNYREPAEEVLQRFAGWLDGVLVKGLGLMRASQ